MQALVCRLATMHSVTGRQTDRQHDGKKTTVVHGPARWYGADLQHSLKRRSVPVTDSRPAARYQPKLQDHGHGAGVCRVIRVWLACNLFPSFRRYQFILLGNMAHGCEQLAQSCCLIVTRPGVEPTTIYRVRLSTITPPCHSMTAIAIGQKVVSYTYSYIP